MSLFSVIKFYYNSPSSILCCSYCRILLVNTLNSNFPLTPVVLSSMPLQDIQQCLEIFLVVTMDGLYWHLIGSLQDAAKHPTLHRAVLHSRELLNILHYTGQNSTADQNTSSAKVGKQCPAQSTLNTATKYQEPKRV